MFIYVDAAGCTNACRHCSVSGGPPHGGFYSLDDLREMAREWGPIIPYHEFTAHPDFPEIMEQQIIGAVWTVLPTNGYGLAHRDDHAIVFSRLRDLGFNKISLSLHGLEEKHDRFVCRKGAFQTILKASRRAVEAGFDIFWNVYLDQQNLADIPPIVELGRQEFGISGWLEVPRHHVGRRALRYEVPSLRPRLRDVERLLVELNPETWQGPLKERNLEELTESAWLNAWRERPDSDDFGPRTWPLVSPFADYVTIHVDKNRKVYYNPMCGELVLVGCLSDGKDEIERRIQHIGAPPFADMLPEAARLQKGDSELLHPNGFSFRSKMISRAIFSGDE